MPRTPPKNSYELGTGSTYTFHHKNPAPVQFKVNQHKQHIKDT